MEIKKNTDNSILSKINKMEERAVMPERIPLISIRPLVGSLTLAYEGYRADEGNEEAHLKLKDESKDKKIPELMTLCFLYGMFLEKYKRYETDLAEIASRNADPEPFLHDTITVYLSDYIRAIGMKPRINKENKRRIIEKITGTPETAGYSEFLGRIRTKKKRYENGELLLPEYKEYELIESFKYDKSNGGMLTFASPYMTAIIWKVMGACIKKYKNGRPQYDKYGRLCLHASYSRHLYPSVLKGTKGRSAEVVGVITTLIDRAGNFIPGISYGQIIERCGGFRDSLYRKSCVSSFNRALEDVFSKAWEILKDETDIGDRYKDFEFPELKPDPEALEHIHQRYEKTIPKKSTLKNRIKFHHHGKKKERDTVDKALVG